MREGVAEGRGGRHPGRYCEVDGEEGQNGARSAVTVDDANLAAPALSFAENSSNRLSVVGDGVRFVVTPPGGSIITAPPPDHVTSRYTCLDPTNR